MPTQWVAQSSRSSLFAATLHCFSYSQMVYLSPGRLGYSRTGYAALLGSIGGLRRLGVSAVISNATKMTIFSLQECLSKWKATSPSIVISPGAKLVQGNRTIILWKCSEVRKARAKAMCVVHWRSCRMTVTVLISGLVVTGVLSFICDDKISTDCTQKGIPSPNGDGSKTYAPQSHRSQYVRVTF
jgi:hypothetical protein